MNQEVIGKWAFIIGLIVSVLAVFATNIPNVTQLNVLFVLFVFGLIIGFLNINKKDTTSFLIGVIALLAVSGSLGALSALGAIEIVTDKIIGIISNFMVLVSSAALVVSIKVVLQTTKK